MNNLVYAEITEKKEKLTPGVYVRSQKIPPIKPNMIQKVGKVMEELGIRKLQKDLFSIKKLYANEPMCVCTIQPFDLSCQQRKLVQSLSNYRLQSSHFWN